MLITKNQFNKIEEIIVYLFGFFFFLDFEVSKLFLYPFGIILILRYFIFKEKLDCGNKNIKYLLISFVCFGVFWNFLAGMSYKPARSFLKISQWIMVVFYLYPVFEKNIEIFKKFILFIILSLAIVFFKTSNQFILNPIERALGFNGISMTGFAGMMAGNIALAFILGKDSWEKKIIYILIYIMSFSLIVFTQMRGALLGMLIGNFCIIFFSMRFKIFIITSVVSTLLIVGCLKGISIPQIERFKTTFNTEENADNESNALRIVMWKNAIWRMKKHPILGSGTKYNEKLFDEYSAQMPENDENEKYLKSIMVIGGFNDAHNMYLNTFVDNGIFSIFHLVIWFVMVPVMFFKNLKLQDKFLRALNIGIGGYFISFYMAGMTWTIWRGNWTLMSYWTMFSVMLYITYGKKEIN